MALSSASRELISRSPDLKRLQDEGYEIEIRADHLLVHHVPYVTAEREVAYGTLVSVLDLNGDRTAKPSTHVVMFCGEMPCHQDGTEIDAIRHQDNDFEAFSGFTVNRQFSSKLPGGYDDYHQKMTTYAGILTSHAQAIEPGVTAKTFELVEIGEDESVFLYGDTASARAGIRTITEKLGLEAVAIVGLGGTGSYILDLVAKTPVKKIHLFDGDRFGHHNAFRAPGAASIGTLREPISKADHFKAIYSRMRRNIEAHDHLDESNVHILKSMSFAFLAVDRNDARRLAVSALTDANVPFVDVGIGVLEVDGMLIGQLRVAMSTPAKRDHAHGMMPLGDDSGEDEYSRNIQIADLNALNATLAVLRWKRHCGFYQDLQQEHSSVYQIDGNCLINGDHA